MPSREEKVLPFIHETGLFSDLQESEKVALAKQSSFILIGEGDMIFAEGSPADGGYAVASGRVLMKKNTHKGKCIVTELLGNHDPFGMVSAAQGIPYPLSAQALCESVVFKVGQAHLLSLFENSAPFRDRLLAICAHRMRDAHVIIAHLADANSEVRVASALLLVASKFGSKNGMEVRIEVTRQELSSVAATTVETCIRVTKAFEGRGILSFPGAKQIVICSPGALQEICNSPSGLERH